MASQPAESEKQSPGGWQRIRALVPKPPLKFLRKSPKRTKPIRRRPAYPPGYKYGYQDSLQGPPKFERVDHWPHGLELRYYYATNQYRWKHRDESEITRQIPLCQQRPAIPPSVLLQSADVETVGAARSDARRPCWSQKQSRLFSLPPEIRLMIYAECFGNTLPFFSPLKYKTRDETVVAKPPSRLGPLLTCRKMHDEAKPALRWLLRDLSLCGLAALYMPWSMPIENLAYIRTLEIDFFFIDEPHYYRFDPPQEDTEQARRSLHSWFGMWDLISNHMSNLNSLTFTGYLLDLPMWTGVAFADSELDILRPLTWLHGPEYYKQPTPDSPDRSPPPGSTPGNGSTVTPKPPSRLRKLNVTLFWKEGQRTVGDSVNAMLAAEGCDVDVSYVSTDWDVNFGFHDHQRELTIQALERSEPALMKTWRSNSYDWTC